MKAWRVECGEFRGVVFARHRKSALHAAVQGSRHTGWNLKYSDISTDRAHEYDEAWGSKEIREHRFYTIEHVESVLRRQALGGMKVLSKITPQPSWAPDATPHPHWSEYYVQTGEVYDENAWGPPMRAVYEAVEVPSTIGAEHSTHPYPKYLMIEGEGAWYWVVEN